MFFEEKSAGGLLTQNGGYESHECVDHALGRHLLVDFYDCDPAVLTDSVLLEKIFLQAAAASGATILKSFFKTFSPQGVSGFIVISESHFSIHSWPEHDYAAVDIFTCSENLDLGTAVAFLQEKLFSDRMIIRSDIGRGLVRGNTLIQKNASENEAANTNYTVCWKEKFNHFRASGISFMMDLSDISVDLAGRKKLDSFMRALCGYLRDHEGPVEDLAVFFNESHLPDSKRTFVTAGVETAGVRINGMFFPEEKSAFLDIFSERYRDPRHTAEFIASQTSAEAYRMKVAFRRHF